MNQSLDFSQLQWLPAHNQRGDGNPRRVGVEIELGGLEPEQMAGIIQRRLGGTIVERSPLDWRIEDTRFGNFKIELDWEDLKTLAEKHVPGGDTESPGVRHALLKMVSKAAETLIPWEVVSPPIAFAELPGLCELVAELREQGAIGTRSSPQYAFGVHLNPELPDLQAETILRYLKAYLCLYDWIVEQEDTDLMRKATYFIKHFDFDYIEKVVDCDYWPSFPALIDDYLADNPTRNRSLDLLPLFSHIDKQRVAAAVSDPRVQSRPTFHYRLPNCDIDNPDWNLHLPWGLWLQVEKLAFDDQRLEQFCREYQQQLARMTHRFESRWPKRVETLLAES